MTHKVRKFRDEVQRDVNRQMRKGGVLVINGPTVPMPPEDPAAVVASYFNYPAANTPVAIFDLGQVTIRGTFDQIAANIQAWSDMPNYLAVADGLSISGTSPNLTATYNVSVLAFLRGKELAPDTAFVAPAADTGAGGGGGGAASPMSGPGGGGNFDQGRDR